MKTKKRLLSSLLSLVMVLGLVPGMSLTAYADTENYPIWIGGTQVTSDNHSGDGWSYTPATEGKDAKLTLNNYTYPGGAGYSDAAIYAEQNLVIELIGENKIVYQQNNNENNCIEVTGHPAGRTGQHYLLTISGSGTLTAEIKSTTNQTAAIYADLLTIEKDATVIAIGRGNDNGGHGVVSILDMTVYGTLIASANKVGITVLNYNNNGEKQEGKLIVKETGSVIGSGGRCGINAYRLNYIEGTAWTNVEGTTGETLIPIWTFTDKNSPLQDTYKKVQFLAKATVSKAPTANALTYTGSGQKLVTAGTADRGTMYYALSDNAVSAPEFDGTSEDLDKKWGISVPKGTNAGTYYVWYMVKGDSYHKDSKPECVTATINKAAATVKKAPTAKTLTYTGSKQNLVDAGTADGGTMQYALGTATEATEQYTTSIPAKSDAGTYYVWYKATDDNHKDSQSDCVTVTIQQKKVKVTAKDQTVNQGGAIATGVDQVILSGAAEGHVLGAVTLVSSATDTATTSGTITPSAVKIVDANGNDVTKNYDIELVNGALTVRGAISAKVTFKVVNGKWDDDSIADKTVTLTGFEGDVLKLAADQIPAVGNKPADTFKTGAWDTAPSVETAITGDTTYTYTYAQKNAISATVTFKVVNGSWDDGATTDKTVTLTGYEGDTLKLIATDIPAVGNKPDKNYKAGSWDVTPSAEKAITEDTTYTYVYLPKDAISAKVTFKVVGGAWNDGTTGDKAVILTGKAGDALKLTAEQIPAAGNKPAENYKAGAWDVTPSAETAIAQDTTYTYTYVQKPAASVAKAPEAKKPMYSGKAQKLVTAGKAKGGTMAYAMTKTTKAPKASAYTENIPTAANAGTYYVWYKAVGDADHRNSQAVSIKVVVYRRGIGDCKITVKDLTYTGKALKPKVTVKYGKTTLKEGKDYTLSYSKKLVNPGDWHVKVTGIGNFKGSKKLAFKVNMPAIESYKLTSDKNWIKVRWSQKARIQHCQIQVSQKEDFSKKKSVKVTLVEKSETHAKMVRGLQEGKKYYVRIRTYKTVGEKTYYSEWSPVKTIKTKTSTQKNTQVKPVEMTVGEVLDLNTLLTQEEIEAVQSWSSDDAEIVAVTPEGVVTAIQQGEATVTAILEDGEEIEFAITVREDGIVLLDLGEDDLTLDLDGDVFGDVDMHLEMEIEDQ